MDPRRQHERAYPFRVLGFSGFAALGAAQYVEGGELPGLLIAGAALLWLLITPIMARRGVEGSSVCLIDCVLIPLAGVLTGMHFWSAVVVTDVLLIALAALSGSGLLLRGTLLTATGWAVFGGVSLPADVLAAPWQTAVAIALLYAFSLGIALVSFHQARHLRARSVSALRESESLKHTNSRLSRYLPESVGRLLQSAPAIRHDPMQRWVTVAFIDVVGFTELVARRPLAEVADVVNDYLSGLTELVADYGGVLGKFLGDGVLIYFQESGAGEADRGRDAARCARLCLAIAPALELLAQRWRKRGLLVTLDTRTGIASGYCAVGDWGGEGRLDYTLIGSVVNLASRLQSEAPPGGILVSETTALLISQVDGLAHRLVSLPDSELRGLGVRSLFQLVDETPASAKVPADSDHPSDAALPSRVALRREKS